MIYDDRELVFGLQLARESAIMPLDEWPDGFAAWVPAILGQIKAAKQKREAAEIQKMKTKPKVG
tara:strand:+ start:151 stop:342 length:192 start_codon:yes stop_codon:yes gene_type:complete